MIRDDDDKLGGILCRGRKRWARDNREQHDNIRLPKLRDCDDDEASLRTRKRIPNCKSRAGRVYVYPTGGKKGEGVQVKQQVSERYRKELERTRESERERVGEIEKGEEVQKRKKKLISCTPYNHLRAESKETEIRPPRPRDHSSHHISAPASYCMRTILTAKCHKKKKKRKFWFGNRPKQQQQQPPQKMIIIRECVGFCFLIYSSRYTSGPMVGRFAGSILFLRLLL
jgi:hypothetical protein